MISFLNNNILDILGKKLLKLISPTFFLLFKTWLLRYLKSHMWLRFVVHIIFLLDSSDIGKLSFIILDFLLLVEIVEHLLVYKLLGVMT